MIVGHFYIFESETFTITLNCEEGNVLEDYKTVCVSLEQGSAKVDKFTDELGIDAENGTIAFHLSQTETALFSPGTKMRPGTANLQVNILYNDGERDVSIDDVEMEVRDNLLREVM